MNELTKSLKHIGACSEAIEWAKPYDTLQAAWDACDRSDWMLWLLNAVNPKRDDLFPVAASFTEHALGHVSDALDSAAGAAGMPEESSVSLRSHSAILRGLRIDSRDAAWAASDAAWAARAAAGAASGAAGEARAAAWAASAAAGAAEMKWQADYIREKFACPVVAP